MENLQETKKALITKFKKFLQNFETSTKTKFTQSVRPNFVGFTLAEVLITLGIIGIVAALTMPAVVANYKKNLVATRFKAAYSMLSQAVQLSEVQNGEYTTWEMPPGDGSYAGQKAWLQKYVVPYIETVEISREKKYFVENCGASFRLKNGTIIYMHVGSAVDLIIDINGLQKPNERGSDQFKVYFDIKNHFRAHEKFIFPGMPSMQNKRTNLLNLCGTTQPFYCGTLIYLDGWQIKDDYPRKL